MVLFKSKTELTPLPFDKRLTEFTTLDKAVDRNPAHRPVRMRAFRRTIQCAAALLGAASIMSVSACSVLSQEGGMEYNL